MQFGRTPSPHTRTERKTRRDQLSARIWVLVSTGAKYRRHVWNGGRGALEPLAVTSARRARTGPDAELVDASDGNQRVRGVGHRGDVSVVDGAVSGECACNSRHTESPATHTLA